ncbi:zinc-binding dehydrogenase [Legionella geestiana]|uniref:bi-domain-containing oxidoreductase n=1 Tax=Legionella geestiana TaxID=45065 RepID=UPI0010929546|nr:bi-domain-containing oxidoreductase [Legionella geestiana]QDQ40001.1 zinc-binding dehydrogenase [Legionella geestiana]
MKQILLSGQGNIEVIESPAPHLPGDAILVQNAFSLISSGTEGAAVSRHKGIRGICEKALNSRHKWHQLLETAKNQGILATSSLVQGKLQGLSPIGYSCAGVVIDTTPDNSAFKIGQRVACMGTGFANHAEIVAIPNQLAVPLPENVSEAEAAFGAIACIAMQGLRRLELSPGERVGIVGLGLIGQIALKLAVVMGYQAYGFDINPHRVAHAKAHTKARMVHDFNDSALAEHVDSDTGGSLLDGILLCAATRESGPVNQAFDLCRQRGRVSVVGDIGLELERSRMYAKELELRLSCSYGPGRYDSDYELGGHDYPLAFARWTERRNLEYFISLLASGQLSLEDLITRRTPATDAESAYALVKSGGPQVFGVLLDYELDMPTPVTPSLFTCEYAPLIASDKVRLGIIGVGGYAKTHHLPNLARLPGATIDAVASKTGASAAVIARKYKARYATSQPQQILLDEQIQAVIISTRHASHAQLVINALQAQKHVFVEKPMATTLADAEAILHAQRTSGKIVRVGFNRRFSPWLAAMKAAAGSGRKTILIRVNVGDISNHWSNSIEEGGRLMGEGVHFFDLATWLAGSQPLSVSAEFQGGPSAQNPDAMVTIRYEDGSVATVIYTTCGNTAAGKEYVEIQSGGKTLILHDYHSLVCFGCKPDIRKKDRLNKGQAGAIAEFVNLITNGDGAAGADALAGYWATAIAELAVVSACEGQRVAIKTPS